ncbi:MAG: hypothetical protein WA783_10785 [Phormidesmis sp.]
MPLKQKAQRFLRRLSLGLLTAGLISFLGIGLAQAVDSPYGMVDPVDARYATGYNVYVEQCATCHIALPPAVLPVETWQTLITDRAHYGIMLAPLTQFDQQLMLNYLQTYSRPQPGGSFPPYRLKDSVYFQALHPNVPLPQPLGLDSCLSCHALAGEQNYSPTSQN